VGSDVWERRWVLADDGGDHLMAAEARFEATRHDVRDALLGDGIHGVDTSQ